MSRSFALDEGIGPASACACRVAEARSRPRSWASRSTWSTASIPQCESQLAWTDAGSVGRLAPRDAGPARCCWAARAPRLGGGVRGPGAGGARRGAGGLRGLEGHPRGRALLNQFFGAFLAAFGVFLLAAAGLVILSARGSRPRALPRARHPQGDRLHPGRWALVLGENLALAAVGAAVGVVAGGLLAPLVELRFAEVLERGGANFPAGVLAGAVAVVLAIVAAATLVPALRAGRVPASRAIARGAGPVSVGSSRLARAALRLGLAPVAVGLKDAGARPLRTWLTVATLAVTVIAIVATLALDRP